MKKFVSILLSLFSIFLLVGCSLGITDKDARDYLDGYFKAVYQGSPKDICKITGEKESDFNKVYDDFRADLSIQIIEALNEENYKIDDETVKAVQDYFVKLLGAFKYDIKSVKIDDDGNAKIKVDIYQNTSFSTFNKEFDDFGETKAEALIKDVTSGDKVPSDEELSNILMREAFKELSKKIGSDETYGEKKEFTLSYKKDKNNVYGLDDKELDEVQKFAFLGLFE